MTTGDDAGRLRCGTRVAALVDQVAEGVPPDDPTHQARCPHCRAALRELEQLWDRVREAAREDVQPPRRLIDDVVRRVRQELRALGQLVPLETVVPRLVRHALLGGPRGMTRIADSVVARIVANTVRATRGVHALSVEGPGTSGGEVPGRLPPRGVEIEVSGHSLTVQVRLVVAYGRSIPAVTAEVRRRVMLRIEALTGLEATKIDIAVDDVFGHPQAPAPRRLPL